MMAAEQAKFLQGNLFRHVSVMSLTASVGLMALFLVDFVDMIFISMLGKSELAAAVGYAGAILFFTTSFGIGMAIAAGSLVARALGAGDVQMAQRRAATSLLYGVIFGAVFAAFVWVYIRPLTAFLGASGETLDLAVSYLRIIVPSLPLLLIGMVGGAILRAHGDAKRAMFATLAAGLVNAALDPLLIFGFGLDLTGAALASVASRVAIAIMSVQPILRYHGGFAKPTREEFGVDFPAIAAIAIPAILTQLATPVGQAFITRTMAQFGEEAIAGMAIIGRLVPISFGALFALSGAVGPIIGQNFGAGRHDRVRTAFASAVLFAALFVTGMSLILFLLRDPIAGLFNAEGMTLTLIYLFCGPLALAFFFNGLMFVSNAAYNNLGHPFYSTWSNWGRHTLGTIPFAMLGAAWFGAPGVLIGAYSGGLIFGLGSTLLALRLMKQNETPSDRPPFQRQARLLALFNLRR
jgi:MATE family, multidrug efflux pump